MVKIARKENENNPLYQCEECGLRYVQREIAEKCETWCREHQSCNLDIIKHAEKV